MSNPDSEELVLTIEKPVAGGRMLARHDGRIVLVGGAIPGEQVRVRVERVGKGVAHADTVEVLQPSPDRRAAPVDWRCGGNVLAHVAYPRQLALKAEIIVDAFARIARLRLPAPAVIASPETGYRMRARLHVRGTRIGFFREGTHELCDPAASGQLLPGTLAWIASVEERLQRERLDRLAWIEIAENIPADERACHFEVGEGEDRAPYRHLADLGPRSVSDVLQVREGDAASALRLHRSVRSFFQGNRFLLEVLVRHVAARVPPGPVVDLYAGVGLFGLSLAAAGWESVTLVEGDSFSGSDLQENAEPFGEGIRVERRSVEGFLLGLKSKTRPTNDETANYAATVIVDPPRTGMSKEAVGGLVALKPERVVYVSCDVATLARDARALIDAGYALTEVTAFDLFPNTAHVESVAVFTRGTISADGSPSLS